MYTDKEDWLIDYYSRYKNFYISGHDSFSKRIGLSNKESEYLHFIGNKKGIYAYILSIGLDFDRDLEDVKSKVEKSSLIEKIKDVFGSLHVILYDKEVKEQNDFWVLDSTFINMDSKSLEKYFSNINPMLTRNKGTIKNINASINDNFQVWGRKHLSKYIVKTDFDIFTLNNPTIFELKRVQQDTAEWMPYLDDKANYRCLKKICYQNKMDFKILAYRQDREMEVAYHKIQKIDDDKIYGMFTLCSPKEVYKDVEDFKDIIRYESRNRRQY